MNPPTCKKMKSKMKTTIFAASVLFGASQVSHATLLVLAGWHDFEGSITNTEAADHTAGGYSGTLTKNNSAGSSPTGGSNDGIYGNSDVVTPAFPVPNAPASNNDGYTNATSSVPAGVTFSLTHASGNRADLKWLYFDALKSSSFNTTLTVQYQIGAGAVTSLWSGLVAPNAGGGGVSENYTDFGIDLTGLFVPNLETVKFFFSTDQQVRIDNVAFIGVIPEPGSVLAIGCLLGSGLLLRNRKTRQSKA